MKDVLSKAAYLSVDSLKMLFYKTGSADLEATIPEYGDGVAVLAQEAGASRQNFQFGEGVIESLEDRIDPVPLKERLGISVEYRDGYCGAPVFNKRGKVVGMVTGKKPSGTEAELFTEIRMQWHQALSEEASKKK
jgi:hypothetical protein